MSFQIYVEEVVDSSMFNELIISSRLLKKDHSGKWNIHSRTKRASRNNLTNREEAAEKETRSFTNFALLDNEKKEDPPFLS